MPEHKHCCFSLACDTERFTNKYTVLKRVDGVKTYVMMYACFGLFLSQGDRDKGDLCLWSQSALREFLCFVLLWYLTVCFVDCFLIETQVDIIINTNS